MATVTRFPFISYLRSETTMHIQHVRGGELRHSVPAAGFWFSPRTAVLAEIPVGDREQAMVLHARTADFQDVAIQATATYRVTEPAVAASRFEFDIDPVTGQWRATPLEVVGGLLTEIVQQPAVALATTMDLRRILSDGVVQIRDAVAAALDLDERLGQRGIAVVDFRVIAVRTAAEVEKALATQTRESIQQDADRATFERRALAVERERAIAENEMQNQIELAKREEQLVNQRGQNGRLSATEQAAADRIAAESSAERVRIAGEAHAMEVRTVGEAEGAAQAASLAAFRDVDHQTLLALALRDLARNLPEITNLTVTPDLLTDALRRFAVSA